jgi:hypothetical protein
LTAAGTLPNPASSYEDAIGDLDRGLAKLKVRDGAFIGLKILILFGGLLLVSLNFPARIAQAAVWLALSGAAFLAAFAGHEKLLTRIRFLRLLRKLYEGELRALGGEFPGEATSGAEFIDPAHPYTADLDIFGPRSLFHFVNRTTTRPGRDTLASLMNTPPEGRPISEHQAAVRDLVPRLDFRMRIRAFGEAAGAADRPALFDRPAAAFPERRRKAIAVLLFVLPPVTLAGLGLTIAGFPWIAFAGPFLAQVAVNRFTGPAAAALYASASRDARILRAYAGIIAEAEAERFTAPALHAYRQLLGAGGMSASAAIHRLSNLLEWLDLRSNRPLHFFANNILMWDVFFIRRIEAWRKKAEPHFEGWFEAVGGIEALASLANLAFNNPEWAFPRVKDAGPRFKAASLGHPLIPAAERVTNDFEMGGGAIAVITGPNMAGKSTFLRTIGVNAVLAFSGGPVCAAGLEIAPLRLAAGMKSTDSLDRRMSLFYAELERLKMILDAIRDHPATFFIIDEMLKGTNEMDRHKGAMALMRQLIARRATGIVATHDLELTGLAAESPAVKNFHFDGNVVGDKLIFDFKLRPGICESFNALLLMKRIGIEV